MTSSRLLIQKAIERDSGLYTCSPNNTHPNSVRVHIVNGKRKMPISLRTGLYVQASARYSFGSSATFFEKAGSLKKNPAMRVEQIDVLENLVTIHDNFYFRHLLRGSIKTHRFTCVQLNYCGNYII